MVPNLARTDRGRYSQLIISYPYLRLVLYLPAHPFVVPEVGGCLSLRAQPGNRFVSFVRGATRREIICPLGNVARQTSTPPSGVRARLCFGSLLAHRWLALFLLVL